MVSSFNLKMELARKRNRGAMNEWREQEKMDDMDGDMDDYDDGLDSYGADPSKHDKVGM